jgi:hypothetical protein
MNKHIITHENENSILLPIKENNSRHVTTIDMNDYNHRKQLRYPIEDAAFYTTTTTATNNTNDQMFRQCKSSVVQNMKRCNIVPYIWNTYDNVSKRFILRPRSSSPSLSWSGNGAHEIHEYTFVMNELQIINGANTSSSSYSPHSSYNKKSFAYMTLDHKLFMEQKARTLSYDLCMMRHRTSYKPIKSREEEMDDMRRWMKIKFTYGDFVSLPNHDKNMEISNLETNKEITLWKESINKNQSMNCLVVLCDDDDDDDDDDEDKKSKSSSSSSSSSSRSLQLHSVYKLSKEVYDVSYTSVNILTDVKDERFSIFTDDLFS